MIRISEAQTSAFNANARRELTLRLTGDLIRWFPEVFGFMEPADVADHVARRIDFAVAHGFTRQDHIAELTRIEALSGDDFTSLSPDHWAYAILTSDRDAERKMQMLRAPVTNLEVAEGFEPSEFD